MAWTAPKIQAMLLAQPKAIPAMKVKISNPPARSPSPRQIGANTRSSYGGH